MDLLVNKAFKSLTTTCNITLLHPNDEDRVKVTLRVLYKKGVTIDLNTLEQWLIKNNWQSSPVKSVIYWTQAIITGGRVQLKNKATAPTEKHVWEKLNA